MRSTIIQILKYIFTAGIYWIKVSIEKRTQCKIERRTQKVYLCRDLILRNTDTNDEAYRKHICDIYEKIATTARLDGDTYLMELRLMNEHFSLSLKEEFYQRSQNNNSTYELKKSNLKPINNKRT